MRYKSDDFDAIAKETKKELTLFLEQSFMPVGKFVFPSAKINSWPEVGKINS